MFVALVTGSVVATQKADSMIGQKLLVVEPYRLDEKSRSRLVATGSLDPGVDDLHAGVGPMADQPQPVGVGEPRRDDPSGPCIQSCRHGISPR